MSRKHNKCIIYISHLIGLTVGISSAIVFYYISRPKCKKEELRKSVKRAFKKIENKIDI